MIELTGIKIATYDESTGEHSAPDVPVRVRIGQGIIVSFAPDAKPEDMIVPDVYIEKRSNKWTINVSTDGDEIRLVVEINEQGEIIVTDRSGIQVYQDDGYTDVPDEFAG